MMKINDEYKYDNDEDSDDDDESYYCYNGGDIALYS